MRRRRQGRSQDGRARRRSPGRWTAAGLLAVLATLEPLGQARAQLLPQAATAVELGDLRQAFERAYGPVGPAPGQTSWSVTPAIDLDIRATDNARGLGFATGTQNGKSEMVATVTPSLLVQGTSQRLTGTLSYSPQLRYFMRERRQSPIGQNLNASARATIFEDLLFFNASAYANESSRAGGLGQGTGANLARQDRVQTTSVSFGPELRHAFGDYGVAALAYTFSVQSRSGQALRSNTPFAPAVTPGDTSTNSVTASFTSGQEFGRINFGLNFQRLDYDGPGVLRGASRQSEILDLGYAATRTVTLLGEIGHQDIRYGGVRPIRIDGVLWSLGFRWNPDPDTSLTLRYGHRDGGDNFRFEGVMAPTGRTRISASYSEAIASMADELLASLNRSQVAGPSVVVDTATGMPVLVNNNFSGAQGGLSRTRRATLSAVLLQDIDTFTLTFNRDERTTLSADAPGAIPGSTFYNGTLSWQRDLAPGLRGNAQGSYGQRSARGAAVNQEIVTLSAGVTWTLSETLSTRASYTYTQSSSNQRGFGYTSNLISLGLRKTF